MEVAVVRVQYRRLVVYLGELLVRVRCPGDRAAGAVDRASTGPVGSHRTDGDAELRPRPGPWRSHQADGAAVDTPRAVLYCADDLHGPLLGRTSDRTARKQCPKDLQQAGPLRDPAGHI